MHDENTLQALLDTVKQYHKDADLNLIKKAYVFADEAHCGQLRKSGEPFIMHPLGTAITLAQMKMNESIIAAGLLHDIPEDTTVTFKQIEKDFGKDIANIVRGITKVGNLKYRGMERYAENLRRMFVAMAKDPRVIIVKFADRLYNLRTLYALPPEKQYRIASETLDIYAPIAGRLGMGEMKDDLEDEAFRYALPKEYESTRALVIHKYLEKKRLVDHEKKIIEEELKKSNIEWTDIQGRAKRLYSLYKKLKKYDNNIDKIYDLIALRIVVKEISDCYAALGVIHKRWAPLKGRIKDYISQPKPNGYQSLHTTVFSEEGDILEVQIRTVEMHKEAEYGLAAHWQYKLNGKIPAEKIRWMKELVNWQKEIKDSQEYLNNLQSLKLDFLQNRIYVFTPKGDVIELPESATPVDFAFLIHTEIGYHCSGARINGKMASLDTQLKNGDVVEILIDKKRKGPNKDWAQFVKTGMAKNRIKAYKDRKK